LRILFYFPTQTLPQNAPKRRASVYARGVVKIPGLKWCETWLYLLT